MKLRSRQTILLVTTFASVMMFSAFTGCSSSTSSGTGTDATCSADIASIQQDIFAASCAQASCHGADQPAAGLDLTRTDIESALVSMPAGLCNGLLVAPGDPSASVLYQKITAPSCGARMPVTGSLSDAQIECIQSWISGLSPSGASGGGMGGGGMGGGGMGGGTSCEMCGGASCVDLQSDAAHCGSCGNACGANMVCNMGTCTGGCGTLTQCGGSCVDVQTSTLHCGTCNVPCPTGVPCTDGKCVCPSGTTQCSNGCFDTTSDSQNCGTCGNSCAAGQACVDGKCACGTSSVSFSSAVQPIFTSKCTNAGCHGGVMPASGMNLTNGKAYNAIVNVASTQCSDGRMRVKPGDPAASYVIDKMTNVDICFGTQMPKLGGVTSANIQTIVDWVCQGAPNN